jgi:hypothetical protein
VADALFFNIQYAVRLADIAVVDDFLTELTPGNYLHQVDQNLSNRTEKALS